MQAARLMEEARALQAQMIRDRRFLHAHAETGFELKNTRAYVLKRLREAGLDARECGRCGAECMLGREGKTFLLRADMDALPMQEESGLPFAAQQNMHACGHDMHTAMLLAAAQLLKRHEGELRGRVKLMFQPAEEILEGSRDMVEAGILENPKPDAAMMLHVLPGSPLPCGTALLPAPGVSAPAAGFFRMRIRGRGSHGAMAHDGVDPVNAAAHIVIALQEIRARELAMHESAALTIGMMHAGAAANAIPDAAELQGSFRAFSDETFAEMGRRIGEIGAGIAAAFRAEGETEFGARCPALVCDARLRDLALRRLPELLGRDRVLGAGEGAARSAGSEDFAFISRRVPSVMLALAAGRPEDGHALPLHNPGVRFDEGTLVPGAAAYAWMAMCWLEENA